MAQLVQIFGAVEPANFAEILKFVKHAQKELLRNQYQEIFATTTGAMIR
jgi:thioredoxin-related protein